MYASGKCPGCKKHTSVAYKAGEARQKLDISTLKVVTYVCSACDTILGVETDPIALVNDINQRVAKRLGGQSH